MFKKYDIDADASIEVKPMIDTLFATRKVFPDTIKALDMLRQRGVDFVIGSTTDTDSITYFLKENSLVFSRVFTSEDLKVYKPHAKFYNSILKQTGWNVEECLFVGDSIVDDVFGPQSIGMRAVLLDRNGSYDINSEIIPDYVINSLCELAEIL